MQDIDELDSRGIPGVVVLSEEFETGAQRWIELHGFEAATVFVRHPIQPLTDDEVWGRADDAFDHILRTIVSG